MQVIPSLSASTDLTPFERAVDKLELSAPPPVVVQRVFSLLADPDVSWRTLAKALSADAGLVARVVRLASSPAFAARPVRDLDAALQVLGFDQLRCVVTTAQLAGRGSPLGRALLAYSLRVAFTCQLLARGRRGTGPDPFLCGLLHDLGTMALEAIAGPDYAAMGFTPGDEQQVPLERARFGFDHADLGAMVAARWNLFPELELIAQLHHAPEACRALGVPEATRIAIETVALARVLGQPDPGALALRDRLCALRAIEVGRAEEYGREGAAGAVELLASLG